MENISIVIPTFNRCEFLKKAIDSSLNQTRKCKVIVCDHGSTDNTPLVAKAYGDKIVYIRRENDFGPHFCWLEGILHAETDFVHLQFDDDWIDNTFIEKTISLFQDDVGIVFTNAAVICEDTKEEKSLFNKQFGNLTTGIYENILLEDAVLNHGLMVSPGACLIRKNDILDALYQGDLPIHSDLRYHGVGPDHFMTLITLLRYRSFGYISDSLAFFRKHDGSITIDANKNTEQRQKLKNGYLAIRYYYQLLKVYQESKIFRNLVQLYALDDNLARRFFNKLFKLASRI